VYLLFREVKAGRLGVQDQPCLYSKMKKKKEEGRRKKEERRKKKEGGGICSCQNNQITISRERDLRENLRPV
jgi:hypothetical protein